jgi:hypothetical protein
MTMVIIVLFRRLAFRKNCGHYHAAKIIEKKKHFLNRDHVLSLKFSSCVTISPTNVEEKQNSITASRTGQPGKDCQDICNCQDRTARTRRENSATV